LGTNELLRPTVFGGQRVDGREKRRSGQGKNARGGGGGGQELDDRFPGKLPAGRKKKKTSGKRKRHLAESRR